MAPDCSFRKLTVTQLI